jgi:hypothetical protein
MPNKRPLPPGRLWRLGAPDGPGRLQGPHGAVYDGGWRAGAQHGHGTLLAGEAGGGGESYTGAWRVRHSSRLPNRQPTGTSRKPTSVTLLLV